MVVLTALNILTALSYLNGLLLEGPKGIGPRASWTALGKRQRGLGGPASGLAGLSTWLKISDLGKFFESLGQKYNIFG